jgi:phospholipid/cholesterol/gamma-HCH transport system permease protein
MIANGVSLYGSYLGCNLHATVSWDLYWYHVFNSVWITDFAPAFIKTYFFGFAIGLVGCYKGYFTTHGTEGVGRSANSSVVLSSMLIFIIDLVAVQITDLMGLN